MSISLLKRCGLSRGLFLIFINLVFAITVSNAQRIVSGKIIDATSRQPLVAASIAEEGNQKHTALSDQDGNFLIRVSSVTTKLIVSFIGFQSASITVTAQQNARIELQPASVNLKDVVLDNKNVQQKFATLAKVDLDLHPVRNTQELLRVVPGLFVAQHAGGGKAEQIFLRGFDCDHGTDIQVSVDGLPVNMVSHAHGQGYADAHFIIPETINNIDYGTGPYYTPHGNLNTAGYVAFSTYNNIQKSQVQVEAGRYNTFRTLAVIDLLKKNKEKQSAYVAGEFNYTNGATINKQNFNRFNLFGKYNLAITPATQLTISGSGFKSKWDASGQIPVRAVIDGSVDRFGSIDPSEGGHTERYNANVIHTHAFSESLSLINQGFYTRNIFSLFSNFTFYLNDPVNGDEINQAEKRDIFGYSSKLIKKSIYDSWTVNSTYGIGVRYDATKNSYLAHSVKRVFLDYVKLGNIREANAYSFIQKQATFSKWVIDAGLRFDYLHFNYLDKLQPSEPARSKTILSPKISVQYALAPAMEVYVKAGKGFHSNDTRVVVANKGEEILPAAYGVDLGVIFKPINNLVVNIAAYYLHLNQEFVYVGDDGNIEPSGRTKRTGIDIIARYQLTKYLFANTNINFTKPRSLGEPKGADYIPLAPRVTSTGGLFYKKKEGFNGGVTYRYIKNRPANEDNSIVAKGYFLLDASVNYSKPKYEVGLAMENILNNEWNEAQFATESRLQNEPSPISELNFTPGTPFFIRAKFTVFF
ncbi:TonB-dependent receptor [Segetibacter aerophilus]|uniref:TonB-dependent receptor n=1 Tax=Segetibacter aerophilus TaxID=670293 RepID=A0A512BFS2_9BACT|nr:TonB-dependent receptor [Segetibacter aerophilus]GEO10819.1 TonB-dependent receptor [Segetibacter aerophilus]